MLKKFLRSVICARGYFPNVRADVVFANPRAQTSLCDELERHIARINAALKDLRPAITVRPVASDALRREILEPVMASAATVADTSELFLRSLQLMRASSIEVGETGPKLSRAQAKTRQAAGGTAGPAEDKDGEAGTAPGEVIGAYVRRRMGELARDRLIPQEPFRRSSTGPSRQKSSGTPSPSSSPPTPSIRRQGTPRQKGPLALLDPGDRSAWADLFRLQPIEQMRHAVPRAVRRLGRQAYERERSLVHVAATRAKKVLLVSWSGAASKIL